MTQGERARDVAAAGLGEPWDVLVIGGGVNGCGIARDLAGRGLRVLLCEQHDLAAHTSSASTKLIHGGLRYLEFHEFALVRKALQEREVLLGSAPHIMGPMRFLVPHDPRLRSLWTLRAGLWLYDHLARRRWLPGSRMVDLQAEATGCSLRPQWRAGFVYSDGWVDDARLVVLNAVDAGERGARVLTRTRVGALRRDSDLWRAELQGEHGSLHIRARSLVNAAGPWAGQVAQDAGSASARRPRLIKGSHVVVRRWAPMRQAWLLQNPDRRIVFVIPYGEEHLLIGTTDVACDGDPSAPRISEQETDYLCESVRRYFDVPLGRADVVWSFSGVRPLLDDHSGNPSAVTRDYLLELDDAQAPLLNVWGGKITTYRLLAEQAADRLCPLLDCHRGAWTARAVLPGGDLHAELGRVGAGPDDLADFERALGARHAWMPPPLLRRIARAYGTRVHRWLGEARGPADLGAEIAPGVFEAELEYAAHQEWARAAEDFLWRRSKCGLDLSPAQRDAVGAWFDRRARGETAAEIPGARP